MILIGALFRANRFRANPTNLYGADEYIEEQIPEKEFRQIIRKLFPEVGAYRARCRSSRREYDEARRLARLILTDIVIYHPDKVEPASATTTSSRCCETRSTRAASTTTPASRCACAQNTEIFTETLQQFVQMKREEMGRLMTGTDQ